MPDHTTPPVPISSNPHTHLDTTKQAAETLGITPEHDSRLAKLRRMVLVARLPWSNGDYFWDIGYIKQLAAERQARLGEHVKHAVALRPARLNGRQGGE